MLDSALQLKKAYEDNNMSPEQIAEDQELDVAAVKAVLMNVSSKYRKDCGAESLEENNLNFTDEQLARVNDRIYELAISAEDEHLAFKALTYVRDDKKGRKEVVRAMAGNTFNLLSINQQIVEARNAVQQRLGQMKPAKQLTND